MPRKQSLIIDDFSQLYGWDWLKLLVRVPCLGFTYILPDKEIMWKMATSFAQSLWVPFWMKEFEGRFCYFSGILDCRIWVSGRKCQFWETCDFLGGKNWTPNCNRICTPCPPKVFALCTRDGVMKGLCTRMCSNEHLLSSTYDPHQHLPK
jgi:hypothetical protein